MGKKTFQSTLRRRSENSTFASSTGEPKTSLFGKICLVTGATDGIGKVTVRELAERGATVIGVGRDPAKIQSAIAEIADTSRSVEFLTADLSSQSQVRALA